MRERSSGPRDARPRIVIIGAGYAGYHCARGLERRLPAAGADIVIVSPTDYMPYLSLLPEVGAGIVDPRHIAVSLPATLRRARLVPGHAVDADLASRSVTVADPDGQRREVGWDRLLIAPGSVSRTLRLPGVLDRSGLAVAEQTDIYYRTDGRPLDHGRPHDHGRRGAASP
jgi:NADH dehydrogenase